MTQPIRQQLSYHPDSAQLFATIRKMPWAVFLDSGRPQINQGRYDILAADPIATLVTSRSIHLHNGSIWKSHFNRRSFYPSASTLTTKEHKLFQICLFVAVLWVILAMSLVSVLKIYPASKTDSEQLPEMTIGIYDWALIVDHQKQQSWLVGAGQGNIYPGKMG